MRGLYEDDIRGYAASTEEIRSAYKSLVAEPKRKRPLGRLRSRWVE
jgi:hypothetical protein